jgi:hypothetical protein
MFFGDLNDPNSEVSRRRDRHKEYFLKPEVQVQRKIIYLNPQMKILK